MTTGENEKALMSPRAVYRLVTLTEEGLRAYDRQGFGTLDKAEEWCDRVRKEQSLELGVARLAELPADVVMLDGEWLEAERVATLYRWPGERPESWWHGDPEEAGPAPPVDAAALVVQTQPRDWIGKLFVGRLGDGWVWNGWQMLEVKDHRICDSAPPGYRGLYAWSIAATGLFGRLLDSNVVNTIALVPVGRQSRELWRLPPLADYVLLVQQARDLQQPGPAFLRTPWDGIAVSYSQLMELCREDCLRPETEAVEIYRPARLTPEGLAALGTDGYSTVELARAAAARDTGSTFEVRAVTVREGLPADVTLLDGRRFVTERERVAPGVGTNVVWVEPAGYGEPVVDVAGNGFLLGRSRLVRIANGLIAEDGIFLSGAPAWMYRLFAKVRVHPLTVNVQGVLVRVDSRDVESWGLPADTKAVLLARAVGAGKSTLAWRYLDGQAFKDLRLENAAFVSTAGARDQVPSGFDAGSASGEEL